MVQNIYSDTVIFDQKRFYLTHARGNYTFVGLKRFIEFDLVKCIRFILIYLQIYLIRVFFWFSRGITKIHVLLLFLFVPVHAAHISSQAHNVTVHFFINTHTSLCCSSGGNLKLLAPVRFQVLHNVNGALYIFYRVDVICNWYVDASLC